MDRKQTSLTLRGDAADSPVRWVSARKPLPSLMNLSSRNERGSMIITSNNGFAELGSVLGDNVLATAILDRLVHTATSYSSTDPATTQGPNELFVSGPASNGGR